MDRIRIALIGYGNVGQAFHRMLERKEGDIIREFGVEPIVTAICTGRRGGVIDAEGMRYDDVNDGIFSKELNAMDIIRSGEYDIMVELTPINIMTGQPATDHIRCALDLGKHVITANKGPVAWHYRELRDLARDKGVQFRHEATVMDGAPVYNLAQETLMGCKIIEVKGILNATTNFVLTEMEKGISYEDAIEEGRRQGFVEADASMDLDGWDASAKLTALMNVLMDVEITPLDIRRTGIGGVTKEDIDRAAAQGKKIKLLCHGWLDENGQPIGVVEPTLVERNDLAAIMDA
ncbi:MAG: hypothetical protein J6Q41_00565, partial [Firmicutes bacterium]|nr:hypothetical protein [Bacillota bacterium]